MQPGQQYANTRCAQCGHGIPTYLIQSCINCRRIVCPDCRKLVGNSVFRCNSCIFQQAPAVAAPPSHRCSSCDAQCSFVEVQLCTCCRQLICPRCRIQTGYGVFHCPACRRKQTAPPTQTTFTPCGLCLKAVPPNQIQTCTRCHRITCFDCRVPIGQGVFHCNQCRAAETPPQAVEECPWQQTVAPMGHAATPYPYAPPPTQQPVPPQQSAPSPMPNPSRNNDSEAPFDSARLAVHAEALSRFGDCRQHDVVMLYFLDGSERRAVVCGVDEAQELLVCHVDGDPLPKHIPQETSRAMVMTGLVRCPLCGVEVPRASMDQHYAVRHRAPPTNALPPPNAIPPAPASGGNALPPPTNPKWKDDASPNPARYPPAPSQQQNSQGVATNAQPAPPPDRRVPPPPDRHVPPPPDQHVPPPPNVRNAAPQAPMTRPGQPPRDAYEGLQHVRLLGQGAQGSVWLCKTATGGEVVVKEMLFTDKDRAQYEKRWEQVSRIKLLSHEHLIRYLDVRRSENPLKLEVVMPYYSEKDMFEFVTGCREPIREYDLCSLILQLATALEYLHEQEPPIIHRDVKLQNILMFEGRQRALLMDLDTAKCDGPTSSYTVIGTAEYMAPETMFDSSGSPKSDVWSLGVVMFALAALPTELLLKDGNDSYMMNAPNWTPPRLAAAIEAAIAKNLRRGNGDSSPQIYTKPTLDLIKSMLFHDPAQRPTAAEVVQLITEQMMVLISMP